MNEAIKIKFKKYKMEIIVILILVGFDQFTKYIALTKIRKIVSLPVIEGVLNFTFVRNRGAAFGLFQGARWFFIIFTIIILVGVFIYYDKLPDDNISNWVRLSLILITAGALGNGIDRTLTGAVVDFIQATFITFMDFPVFNIADIYVVIGTVLLSILLIFYVKEDGQTGEKI